MISNGQPYCNFEHGSHYRCEITRTEFEDHPISFHFAAEKCNGVSPLNFSVISSQGKLWLSLLTLNVHIYKYNIQCHTDSEVNCTCHNYDTQICTLFVSPATCFKSSIIATSNYHTRQSSFNSTKATKASSVTKETSMQSLNIPRQTPLASKKLFSQF